MGSPRRRLIVALSLFALGCGGADRGGSTTAPTGLGVQSNVAHRAVTLRMRADAPMAFATQLRVQVRAEMLGHPLDASMDTLGLRRVAPRGEGAIEVEETDTRSTLTLSMMGRSRSGPTHEGPSETRRYVMGERGRRIDAPSSAPTSRGLEAMVEPVVRAMELPEQPVAPGTEWRADGTFPMSVIDPMLVGEARFDVVQRLDRIEGDGEQRVAVIAFDAVVEGMGEAVATSIGTLPAPGDLPGRSGDPHAMPRDPMPDPNAPPPLAPEPGTPLPRDEDPMPGEPAPMPEAVGGRMQIRGFYAVALADGFARVARAEVTGEARMGPGALLLVPFAGVLDWNATPIDAALVTPQPQPAGAGAPMQLLEPPDPLEPPQPLGSEL